MIKAPTEPIGQGGHYLLLWVRCRTDSLGPLVHYAGMADDCQTINGITLMLETIAIILVILWALGLVSSVSLGGFIHVLLVLAVVVIVVRLISGRRL